MKHLFIVPALASMLLAGVAVADTSSPGTGDQAAAAPDASGGPDGGHHWHKHHHGMGFMHRHDPLASVQKPMTANSVKQALDAWFARRPEVKSVTEKDANILVVEIVDPDGKTHRFELNRTTGERRPAW